MACILKMLDDGIDDDGPISNFIKEDISSLITVSQPFSNPTLFGVGLELSKVSLGSRE